MARQPYALTAAAREDVDGEEVEVVYWEIYWTVLRTISTSCANTRTWHGRVTNSKCLYLTRPNPVFRDPEQAKHCLLICHIFTESDG